VTHASQGAAVPAEEPEKGSAVKITVYILGWCAHFASCKVLCASLSCGPSWLGLALAPRRQLPKIKFMVGVQVRFQHYLQHPEQEHVNRLPRPVVPLDLPAR
jgi:hypothetical protein